MRRCGCARRPGHPQQLPDLRRSKLHLRSDVCCLCARQYLACRRDMHAYPRLLQRQPSVGGSRWYRNGMLMMRIGKMLRSLLADQRGNVLMIFGFSLVPMVFATVMGIDYARAMTAQTKLNAAADAAALS